jgi:hypothetical protein
MPSLPVGSISNITEQVSREASSAAQASSHLFSSGWGTAFTLLLLLPVISLFTRPLLRLAATSTHSISAIGSALITCLSSWVITLIQLLTTVAYAIRPTPRMMPFIRVAMATGISVCVIQYCSISSRYLIGVALLGALGWATYYFRLWHKLRFTQRFLGRCKTRMVVCGGIFACILAAAVYLLQNSSHNLNDCLQNGQVSQACLAQLHAERF